FPIKQRKSPSAQKAGYWLRLPNESKIQTEGKAMRPFHKTFSCSFSAVLTAWFAVTAAAQDNFWQQMNGPYGGDIRALAINSNGHIFAGGGGIFRSTNNGDSWTALNNV
ncbi:MAG: WD40/YVTN/BNR-like repeat-containing protein, partial [bacterium]